MATQAREPEMGLTFEKVWAMFQESDRCMQKLNEETAQQRCSRQSRHACHRQNRRTKSGPLRHHTRTGDAVKIDVPEGFFPKAW